MKINIFIMFLSFVVITGCNNKNQGTKPSLPTRGKLIIGIDESLRPFTEAEIATFSVHYPETHVTPLYLSEKQIIEKLLANDIQTCIICRKLLEQELDFIKRKYRHTITTVKLAESEIVPIVNQANPLNTVSYNNIRKILSGTITDWRRLNSFIKTETPIRVVIPGSSSIDRYLSSYAYPFSPESTYSLDYTIDAIDYVKKNISAMGLTGGCWFYRKGDKYPGVKVLDYMEGTPENESRNPGLLREIYGVTHEPFTGLGNGFISFVAGHKGQLIISKSGLKPAKSVEREIKIKRSF